MSVGKGRPDRLTGPPGGSERSERGGMFILVGKGRPDRLTGPPGGSERSERGGMFILVSDPADPRAWPATRAADARVAALYASAQAAMDATASREADAFDGEARRWLEGALGASHGGDLADALANAPSAAVARHLRRLLAAIVRGDPASDARLRTTLFAMPVILVAALEQGAQPVTLTGAIATAALAGALRDARAFGGCETFALSTSLVATSRARYRGIARAAGEGAHGGRRR